MKPETPRICSAAARERFLSAASKLWPNPDSLWVGGYVEYEWQHARHIFESVNLVGPGCRVLEFGCNVGATSVVLAAMGANVTAIDVNPAYVEVAALNAECYGLQGSIQFAHVADTTRLPFNEDQFDLVTCNSVLEYVLPASLRAVQREIDRVLKPGGTIAVLGTSNRLWPREVHSGRWLVNYLPRRVDALLGTEFQRGIFARQLRYGFGCHYRNRDLEDRGASYLEARKRIGSGAIKNALLAAAMRVLSPLGISVGQVTPNISVLLRKGE
jgi:SAM-dependent methyltransferase